MSPGRRPSGALFVNVLGGFRVAGPRADDALVLERRRSRALLAILAIDLGRQVPRDRLTAYLWSSQTDDAARHGLRQCLLDLRHALAEAGVDAIRSEGDGIALDPSRVVVDAARFETLAARNTVAALNKAMALYQGDLLEGLRLEGPDFEEWLRLNRERLRSQAIGAMKKLLAHNVRQKTFDHAIQVGIRLLALEPFDEAVHRTMMALYAETGRRSGALRQYEQCVEVLSRELDTEPEAETRELYRQLIADRPRDRSNAPVPDLMPRKVASQAANAQSLLRPLAASPLIGREADLEWLDGVRHSAQHGQPQLALVVGEAGIGKSRLIHEFASRAQHHRAQFLVGRGREGEEVLAFAPWVEALRPTLSADLIAGLAPVTRQDLARLFPEIADRPSPPPNGLEDGPRIFEAVAHLFRELATRHSLVVVIEDLHWCDDMTVRLLRFLPRRLEGRRVLLIGTARPEDLADGPDRTSYFEILRRDPSCASRSLAPLSRDDVTKLFASVTSRTDALSEVLIDRVWTISEGNPFVVVECARAMRERHAHEPDRVLDLPEGVRTLTARSLARLSEGANRLADVAAVIGRDFDMAVLRDAAGLTLSGAADGLEELVRRRVLREVNGHFDFGHDRVREVCYDRLLGPRRALLHQRVADALVRVYSADPAPYFAAIGTHYRQAGAWEEACDYLARAGFQAWLRGAGREAVVCFEDALQCINRLPDTRERRQLQVHLRIAANGAYVALGSYERGRPHLLAAEPLAATLPERRWQGLVAVALCNSLRAAGAPQRALAFGRRAMDVAQEIDDRGLQSAAVFRRATSGSLPQSR
jgi:DNA-binding SARP family transcriptional activator